MLQIFSLLLAAFARRLRGLRVACLFGLFGRGAGGQEIVEIVLLASPKPEKVIFE